jgi:uncharacterized protein (TIGR00159 family)
MLLTTIPLKIIDILDILLVALLLYQVYKLLRGTAALRILYGIIALFLIWKLVSYVEMKLLSEIFGAFISVGIIALIVVFQPEIRRFLLKLGTAGFFRGLFAQKLWNKKTINSLQENELDEIITSCKIISETKTGGLIVIAQNNELEDYIETGVMMDSLISSPLIISIFFKNNPLHDGAIIINKGRIASASCILPVSKQQDIAQRFGLRHRAGIGISELTDAISIIISEETGSIEIAKDGVLFHDLTLEEVRAFFTTDLSNEGIELPHLILAKRFFSRKFTEHN